MTYEKCTGIWDEGNKEKCRKHWVPLDVIEDIFNRPVMTFPDDHSDAETRFKAIGKAKDNRHVFCGVHVAQGP